MTVNESCFGWQDFKNEGFFFVADLTVRKSGPAVLSGTVRCRTGDRVQINLLEQESESVHELTLHN